MIRSMAAFTAFSIGHVMIGFWSDLTCACNYRFVNRSMAAFCTLRLFLPCMVLVENAPLHMELFFRSILLFSNKKLWVSSICLEHCTAVMMNDRFATIYRSMNSPSCVMTHDSLVPLCHFPCSLFGAWSKKTSELTPCRDVTVFLNLWVLSPLN